MIDRKIAFGIAFLGSSIASNVVIAQDSKPEAARKGPVADVQVELPRTGDHPASKIAFEVVSQADEAVPLDDVPTKAEENPNNPIEKLAAGAIRYYVQTQAGQKNPNLIVTRFDPLDVNFGLGLSETDAALRAQLEIPDGEGIVVVELKAGGLADLSGLKLNDVLLSLGPEAAKTVPQARKILLDLGKQALEVKLIRQGKPRRMSLVGPDHSFPTEVVQYWIGVPVSPVDATLRSHLSLLPAEAGLIAIDVVKGSPADQAAVQKNDILIAIDGKPLKTSASLIEQVQATQGKPVPLKILRAGKELSIMITPIKRELTRVANFMSIADSQFKYQVVRPNMAIEVNAGTTLEQKPSDPTVRDHPLKNFVTGQTLQVNPKTKEWTVSTFSLPNKQTQLYDVKPFENRPSIEVPTARIEAQLKDVLSKLDALTKVMDGMKKPN